MPKVLKIAIVGYGNAGKFLAKNFSALGLSVDIFTRNDQDKHRIISDLSEAVEYDIVLLCVPDNAISEVSSLIAVSKATIAHISGTTSINAIDGKHEQRAIFWPLMTLNTETKSPIADIPFCLETSDEASKILICSLVNEFNLTHCWTTEIQRQKLHLAAVLSQNFSNHLFQLAYDEIAKEGLDFEMFKPILLETVQAIGKVPPMKRQTGPAVRSDQTTIRKHLEMLEGENKDIYELLTRSIQKRNEREL